MVTAVAGPDFGVKSVDVFVNAGASCHLILDVYGYFESGLPLPG